MLNWSSITSFDFSPLFFTHALEIRNAPHSFAQLKRFDFYDVLTSPVKLFAVIVLFYAYIHETWRDKCMLAEEPIKLLAPFNFRAPCL